MDDALPTGIEEKELGVELGGVHNAGREVRGIDDADAIEVHVRVVAEEAVDPFERRLFSLLDGSMTVRRLVATVRDSWPPEEAPPTQLATAIRGELRWFGRAALLEA